MKSIHTCSKKVNNNKRCIFNTIEEHSLVITSNRFQIFQIPAILPFESVYKIPLFKILVFNMFTISSPPS